MGIREVGRDWPSYLGIEYACPEWVETVVPSPQLIDTSRGGGGGFHPACPMIHSREGSFLGHPQSPIFLQKDLSCVCSFLDKTHWGKLSSLAFHQECQDLSPEGTRPTGHADPISVSICPFVIAQRRSRSYLCLHHSLHCSKSQELPLVQEQ